MVATFAGDAASRMGVIGLRNAAPGGPVVSNATGGGGTTSLDLTTAVPDTFVVGSYIENGGDSGFADPFATTLYRGNSGSSTGIAGYQNEALAGTKTYAYTGGDGDGGIALAGFAPFINPDRDYDGLPDAWELEQFGTLTMLPGDDHDGDGFTNGDEYVAGTDPDRECRHGPGGWLRDLVEQCRRPHLPGALLSRPRSPVAAAVRSSSGNGQRDGFHRYRPWRAAKILPDRGHSSVST